MEKLELFKDAKQESRLQAEAEFAYGELSTDLESLPKTASILEVGCGTGLLLTRIAQEFREMTYTGVEPIGPGFAQFASALDAIEAEHDNIKFIRDRIEDIDTDRKFDLIYSVNVFEHLDDWRLAIDKCVSLLNSGGKLVILCPNYWVPYESHFALPVLWNKTLTHKIFSRKIARLEEEFDAKGLWQSLNFITAPQIHRYCKSKDYRLTFDSEVMVRMLNRLDHDPEFRKRQSKLARIAGFANKLGAGSLLRIFPARFSAYMRVSIEP